MQQRRLRLGDILDDYCPRERRITNHAVVAMIEDDVRLTRCTTCDTEHDYKQAKAPTLRRKKDSTAAAYKEVLAEVTGELPAVAPQAERPVQPQLPLRAAAESLVAREADSRDLSDEPPAEEMGGEPIEEGQQTEAEQEAARVHRRLIRATLPRIESQVTPRPIPQFTMRQPTGRPGKFRGAQGHAQGRANGPRHVQGRAGGGNGNVVSRSPFPRGGGASRPGGGHGQSGAGRPGGGHGQSRRGKKR